MNLPTGCYQLKVNTKVNGIGSSMNVVLVLIFVNMVQHVFVQWTKKWPFFIIDFENVVVAWIPPKILYLITL